MFHFLVSSLVQTVTCEIPLLKIRVGQHVGPLYVGGYIFLLWITSALRGMMGKPITTDQIWKRTGKNKYQVRTDIEPVNTSVKVHSHTTHEWTLLLNTGCFQKLDGFVRLFYEWTLNNFTNLKKVASDSILSN